jgi:1-acyl-sn-glycerol-3-phosphate acyltransferase
MCYLFGKTWLRLRYVGAENLPRSGAVLLVANHSSHLDPPMLGCGLPRRVRYMAKSGLRKVPIMGRWIANLEVLFVERDGGARAGIEMGIAALREDQVLGVFPEGTRGPDTSVRPFKRGILLILEKSTREGREVTVLPAGIRGTARAFPKGAWFPRPRRVEVHFGRPLSSKEVLADRSLQSLRREVSILAGIDPGAGGETGPDRPESSEETKSSPEESSGRGQDDSLTSHSR